MLTLEDIMGSIPQPEEEPVEQTPEEEEDALKYRYDNQLLIDGKDLDDNAIRDYINNNLVGNCLLVVGDSNLIKIHFHTNEPWKLLEYCSTLGEIYDIVVEDMVRQASGLHG